MIKNILLLCLLVLISSSSWAVAEEKPSILVELFTSEFCPACPPADKYLEKISKNSNVVALGCHVTYFSRKSNLGRQFCSQRQFDYMQRLRERTPYTPQFVVNGRRSIVGTDTDRVAAGILKSGADKLEKVTITAKPQGVYSYNLPKIKRGLYEIIMVTYLAKQDFKGSTYVNAVDRLIKVGVWDGGENVRVVYPNINKYHKGLAIFVQDKRSGEVVAAGDYRI